MAEQAIPFPASGSVDLPPVTDGEYSPDGLYSLNLIE